MSRKKKFGQSKEERRTQTFEQLARLRQIERKTIEECANELKVSPRTIQYYLADTQFQETVNRLRAEWKENAVTHVAQLTQTALETMADLMSKKTKSEHVRFEAAKAIGDWVGLGIQEGETGHDDRDELDRLQILLAERAQITVNQIYQSPVEPGGFLPVPLQRVVDANEFLPAQTVSSED